MNKTEERNMVFVAHEDKTSTKGKDYTRFQDSTGEWYSTFEKPVIDFIKASKGNTICVQLAFSDNYNSWSIRGAKEWVSNGNISSTHTASAVDTATGLVTTTDMTGKDNPYPEPKVVPFIRREPEDKHKTMYVSYAKDTFKALIEDKAQDMSYMEVMELAIKLVKRARDSF